ncbi:DMT family transporter [uncultured Cellulomonas sp.]|uniref:EamA family transporter n=1 Tax=uncultured Cellulomonas sp. TaxID=189682 RepID=UPI002601FC3E|nr:EamA family transporter [uncultured Cellulomonas sp.]
MRSGALDRVPAPALFIASGLTQYVGAAIAVGLFATVAAPTVAWLRIVVAAVVLVLWRRPWRTRWDRRDLLAAALFGAVLAAMNVAFYVAIDHLPLGTAVAIEFIGPVAVAAVTGRGWRERAGIALAAAGVVLLAGVTVQQHDGGGGGPDVVVGLIAIGVSALCWAGYILLGRRIAVRGSGVSSLSLAMVAGAVVFAPFLARDAVPVLADWRLALAVIGVGVLSSAVPYAIDQVVLRRIGAAAFAVLLALLPATAAVVGAVALRQWPHGLEVVGLLAVSGAIVLTSGRSAPASRAPEPVTPG